MSRRREESDLARVLAMSREDGGSIGAERASEQAILTRPLKESNSTDSSKRRKTKSSPEAAADVFQSRTPPRSATRSNPKRSTPERRPSRQASSMKIGNEIYSGESMTENSDEHNATLSPNKRRGPDSSCLNSNFDSDNTKQHETSSGTQNRKNQNADENLSASAADSLDAPKCEQEQEPQTISTDTVQEPSSGLSELAYSNAKPDLVLNDQRQSDVTDVANIDSNTNRSELISSSSSNSEARRRLLGKPQRKAAPYTSRMAGLTRTSRIPPLHTHRKSPPPAKPRFVTSKPADQKPANSDEEGEPEPEVDYENEGFL